jgi:hypothetical protein
MMAMFLKVISREFAANRLTDWLGSVMPESAQKCHKAEKMSHRAERKGIHGWRIWRQHPRPVKRICHQG